MKVSEFAQRNKFNNRDKNIVEKLHPDEDKTEQEWFVLFNGKIDFDTSLYNKKMEKINTAKKAKQVEPKKEE